MLERTNQNKTANNVVSAIGKGVYTFDNTIQRALVWGKSEKSELIYSTMYGYPIPQIFCKKTEIDGKKVFDVLDGKQRLKTIEAFMKDEFPLTKLSDSILPFENEDGEIEYIDLDGLKYSQLPKVLRDTIAEYNLSFVIFDSLSVKQERELFRRLNNGKALSTKSKNLSYCQDLDKILQIGEHSFFEALLSNKARENKNQATIIMKMLMMLNYDIDNVSFESKKFNPFVREVELTDKDEDNLMELIEYIDDAYSISPSIKNGEEVFSLNAQKKFMKETHLISLVPFLWRAKKEGISTFDFFKFVDSFYGTNDRTSISEAYNEACNGGSAKATTIKIRHEELEKAYCEFFNVEPLSKKNVEDTVVDTEDNKEIPTDILGDIVNEETPTEETPTEETPTEEIEKDERIKSEDDFPMNPPVEEETPTEDKKNSKKRNNKKKK